MPELPTLIILAESESRPTTAARQRSGGNTATASDSTLETVQHTLQKGLASGLQVILVAPPMVAAQCHHILPAGHVILLPDHPAGATGGSNDQMALGVAVAVIASAQSPGWLLLPADMPLLQTSTLKLMGQAVLQDPLVFPEYRHLRGHPIGFSAEFYSELIRLQRERDLQRLLAQYPARGVDVDDPGILMAEDNHHDLALLRTVLQGHTSLSVHP
jgi:molybdenum cofactor cytidylyltransferase